MVHTDTKRAPKVMDEDTWVVRAWFEARAVREKRRKRDIADTVAVDNGTSWQAHVDTEAADNKVWSLRYPEIRGLRFCPERRMYFVRDQSASLAADSREVGVGETFSIVQAFEISVRKIRRTQVPG